MACRGARRRGQGKHKQIDWLTKAERRARLVQRRAARLERWIGLAKAFIAVLLNAEVEELKYLGTLENIFVFNENPYHEIVQVYDGVLIDSGLYDQALIAGREANGEPIRAMWKSLDHFKSGECVLYPTGLLELLDNSLPQRRDWQ